MASDPYVMTEFIGGPHHNEARAVREKTSMLILPVRNSKKQEMIPPRWAVYWRDPDGNMVWREDVSYVVDGIGQAMAIKKRK